MSKTLKIILIIIGAIGVIATGVVIALKYVKRTQEGLSYDEDYFDEDCMEEECLEDISPENVSNEISLNID